MKSSLVHLEFMGQRLAIKAQGDPLLLNDAVALASLKLKDVEKRSKTAVAHQVALLALLEMCEEYLRAKQRTGEMRERLIDKAKLIAELAAPHGSG